MAVVQLGENLYKNTYGVLIEYITNSYDADASYVNINIERDKGTIIIKDDGIGMSLQELSEKSSMTFIAFWLFFCDILFPIVTPLLVTKFIPED